MTRVLIVTPAPPRSRSGNRVTAQRWASLLRGLGHRVAVRQQYAGQPCDVLVALHARKSHPSVARFRRQRPHDPVVVALTGTDLYGDLRTSARARRSLEMASELIVLQAAALADLPLAARAKAHVIYQSARRPPGRFPRRRHAFEVCVLAHLRPVKDPLRAGLAARRLPASSRLRVLHLGAAVEPALAARARAEQARNPRYRWLGERSHGQALRLLARCLLLVLTSRMEGGANVVSEALACGVPVLSSRIAGSIGLLGPRYPGYYPVADAAALARLLERAESDRTFLAGLRRWCRRRARLVRPARERRSWSELLRRVAGVC